jgi:hypothetical protein
MPGDGDRRDRNEATRLFVAAVVALVLLIVVVGGALYFFTGWVESASDPFAAGLGLKNAALISFAVSFIAILIMTVASGGDAIFGELPFTIVGFLIFFVVFWLMIAWIF